MRKDKRIKEDKKFKNKYEESKWYIRVATSWIDRWYGKEKKERDMR